MNKCPVCEKGEIRLKPVKDYQYPTPMGLVTIDDEVQLEQCLACGEVFVPGVLIDQWNRLILQRLIAKHSRLNSIELQFIFSVLPYSQIEIAKATGKDRSTLTKYKTGENPIDPLFEDALQQIITDYLGGTDATLVRLKERAQFVFTDEKIGRLKFH